MAGAAVAPPGGEWPPGPGEKIRPQVPDPELRQLLSEIDPARMRATIEKLMSFGTRHALSSQTDPNRGIGAATNWYFEQMQAIAATWKGVGFQPPFAEAHGEAMEYARGLVELVRVASQYASAG
jgi:hypothetical protein